MIAMREVKIDKDYITLGAFLKWQNIVSTGGEAKILIQLGKVRVNNEVCTMRGKKLRPGDTVEVKGQAYRLI
jgi:S4 domain.